LAVVDEKLEELEEEVANTKGPDFLDPLLSSLLLFLGVTKLVFLTGGDCEFAF